MAMDHGIDIHIPTLLIGVAIGGLPLLIGVIIGVRITRRNEASTVGRQQAARHVHELVRGLFAWTHKFAGDVGQSRLEMEDIGKRLRATDAPEFTFSVAAVDVVSQMTDANERLQCRLNTAEITLKRQAEEIVSYLSEARTDALTGLPNRRAFDDEVARRFAEKKRHGVPFTIVLLDVDHFKRLNDRLGHPAGDQVLQNIPHVMAGAMRQEDMLARIGGEEFALILPHTTLDGGQSVARRTLAVIANGQFTYEGTELRVTVSCGMAEVGDGDNLALLLKRVDSALYASKNAGRNCGHFHNGRWSQPLGASPASADDDPPDEADRPTTKSATGDEPVSDAFDEVCNDLRRRLSQIVEEEAAASAST